ncbi:MAG: serine hydrolase [Clostridia bacterium]|nr:serine hydrolase [Clostridia bacterium]
MDFERVRAELQKLEGNIGVFIEAGDGSKLQINADAPIEAASVIKLPIMGAVFEAAQAHRLSLDEMVETRAEEMMPGCGVLTRMHAGLRVTVRDLVVLMIIVSDNTATNRLIDLVGMDTVNGFIDRQGLRGTRLRRKLFDEKLAARGIQNTVTAMDMGLLLRRILDGTLVSPEASGEMLDILSCQQLNGKIPFYLSYNLDRKEPISPDIDCAHKTGEDTGITHDVGILFTDRPSIFCFLSEQTDVQKTLRAIQKTAGIVAYPERTDFA